jgi:myosin heavy subunit
MTKIIKSTLAIIFLISFPNYANAVGFKLNCKVNEFDDLKSIYKTKLANLGQVNQIHEFIGRDVKLFNSNLYGELKYNGLHYGKKLQWIHYVDDLIISYIYRANKFEIGTGRLNVEGSFRKKQFQAKKTIFDYNGKCIFSKIEKSVVNSFDKPKIIIKEDKESKKLAEQHALELEEERTRLKAMEIEREKLEEKTKQLAEQNRLAELNAKKRSEEIAKEVAAQEREKLEKERGLRRAEEKARKIAQEKAKQLATERQKAEKVAKQLELERMISEKKNKERLTKLDEERKKSEKITEQLLNERSIAEQKAKDLEKTQLASLQKEKAKRYKLIQEEKKKREELEKKLAELREQNKNPQSKTRKIKTVKLPPEWMPYSNDMSIQQKQFCQLTSNFFKDMDKAISSRNEIRINMVHRDRQENLDGLLPSGRINNWIFKVVKIDQVEDGSAAVVLSLQCNSYVGSGQIYTKSTWLRRSNKEWRATIPYEDRRFKELAKLGVNDFILASGTLLEVEAFKPGQIETFYASQQIGEHPLTKGLNLEGELFIANLSYIAALN